MAGAVDVEQDTFFLKNVLEDAGYPQIAEIIKRAFDTVIPQRAIDFKTNAAKVISQCLQMHGVPMFRTTYAKQPFPMDTVLMVCYGSHDGKMKGVWLRDTPPEDMTMLAMKRDGYRLMLSKYGRRYAHPAAIAMGGPRITGQMTVSEAIDNLDYYVDGEKVGFEEFEKAWMRNFPNQPVPRQPFYAVGKTHIFTITVPFQRSPELEEIKQRIKERTPLEVRLISIEARLKEMLADEEKAVSAYGELKKEIVDARYLLLKPLSPHDIVKDRYLLAAEKRIEAIASDEGRHRDLIRNTIPAIQELMRTLELERTGADYRQAAGAAPAGKDLNLSR